MDLELYQAFEQEIGKLRADILYKEVLIKKLQAKIIELQDDKAEEVA